MHLIYAFVGQSLVDKYGAYAGFAAIPGLAVLAMLYFAQAREVKRLRTWAEGVATGRDSVPASRPAPATAAAGATRPRPAPPGPARPATVSKPSLGPPKPAAAAAAAAAAGAASANDKNADEKVSKPGVTADPAVPAAATAAAAAKGAEVDDATASDDAASEDREREPAVAGAAAGAPTALREREGGGSGPSVPGRADTDGGGSPDRPGPPRSARPSSPNLGRATTGPRSAAALRSGRPSATVPPRTGNTAREQEDHGRRRPIALIAGGVVILLIGVILAVTQLGGGSDNKKTANTIEGTPAKTQTDSGGGTTKPKKKPAAVAVNRGAVTVAVLNGTTAPGLAATIGDQLETDGFKRGLVANAADQQQQATTVFYGPNQKAAAQEVAKLLKISTVKQLDAGTQAIAGADAGVVVIVGADRTS